MTGAHSRLESLWDALESQGAHVQRLPLHTITARTATRLAATAEYRLRILAEAGAPPPARWEPITAVVELVRHVVEHHEGAA